MIDIEPPQWDQAFADQLLGKTAVVGVTYVSGEDEVIRRVQVHGVIGVVDPSQGVRLDLAGLKAGEVFWLPPQIDNFLPAERGSYQLKQTGEEVVDPDFVSTWVIHAPPIAEDWD